MKKKNIILYSVLTIAVLGLVLGLYFGLKSNKGAKGDGTITVEVVALDGSIVESKEITYQKGDKIDELISQNFDNVTYDNGAIMTIESLETGENWNPYIAIYLNDEYAQYGITDSHFTYESGDKIRFVLTEYIPN